MGLRSSLLPCAGGDLLDSDRAGRSSSGSTIAATGSAAGTQQTQFMSPGKLDSLVAPIAPFAYPTGGVLAAGAISFGVGVAVGAIFNGGGWGWGCNWGAHPSLYVNNNFFSSNRNTFVNRAQWGKNYIGNGRAGWNHNPRYRGPVPYPNRDVANNGGRPAPDTTARKHGEHQGTGFAGWRQQAPGQRRPGWHWGRRPPKPTTFQSRRWSETRRTWWRQPASGEYRREPAGWRTAARIDRFGEPGLARRSVGWMERVPRVSG
jgi:hypothetical protein